MTDSTNYCEKCGGRVQADDAFCGNCGSPILSSPAQADQIIPREEAVSSGESSIGRNRRLFLVAGLGVCAILLFGVGAAIALTNGRSDLEPLPGVYADIPEGWALSSSSNEKGTIDGEGVVSGTHLIPEQYRDVDDDFSVQDEDAIISLFQDENGSECDPQRVQVDDMDMGESLDPEMQDDLDALVGNGFADVVTGYGSMDSGEARLSGTDVRWNLSYISFASSWGSPGETLSEYPNYDSSSFLHLCLDDLTIGYYVGSELFEPESQGGQEGPTMESNAYFKETRDQVHDNANQRYETNFQALEEFLESINTGWFSGGADLEGLPSSIEGYDEFLDDPFDGELVAEGVPPGEEPIYMDMEGDAVDNADEEDAPESTVPEETTTSDFIDSQQQFITDYYEAVDREDWSATYDLLDLQSQEVFTEEEWIEVQEAREAATPVPPLEEAILSDQSGEEAGFTAEVTLVYEDGTEEIIDNVIVTFDDNYEFKRFLTDSDISYLEGLIVESTVEDYGDEEQAVADAIRGHYEAIGRGDFEEAYSYFGPSFRAVNSQENWVADEESYEITDSTINSLRVVSVSGETAQAEVDVSFEDNTGTSDFYLGWELVLEDGEWKLDQITVGGSTE